MKKYRFPSYLHYIYLYDRVFFSPLLVLAIGICHCFAKVRVTVKDRNGAVPFLHVVIKRHHYKIIVRFILILNSFGFSLAQFLGVKRAKTEEPSAYIIENVCNIPPDITHKYSDRTKKGVKPMDYNGCVTMRHIEVVTSKLKK